MTSSEIFTKTLQKGRKIIVHTVLKNVWNIAICVAGSINQRLNVISINDGQSRSIMKNIIEPNTLNIRWIRLALFAFAEAPSDDIRAVTHEPMFVPRMM